MLSVIQRFVGRGENPDDLFQVGRIGLLKAIANFDETKEVRFSTYGVPMIAGEVRRYLRDNSAMRVSRSLRDTAYRVLQCKEAMMGENGRGAQSGGGGQADGAPPWRTSPGPWTPSPLPSPCMILCIPMEETPSR